jgi:hypothetical protein
MLVVRLMYTPELPQCPTVILGDPPCRSVRPLPLVMEDTRRVRKRALHESLILQRQLLSSQSVGTDSLTTIKCTLTRSICCGDSKSGHGPKPAPSSRTVALV